MIIDHRFETTLSDAHRDAVAAELQATLVQLIDVALQSKQLHWTVVGPSFRPLHMHLDEIVADVRAWSDDVAERCSALGVAPIGTAQQISASTTLPAPPTFFVQDEDAAHLMVERLLMTAAAIRDRLSILEPMDVGSHDLLIGVLTGLEKHAWMLRASTLQRLSHPERHRLAGKQPVAAPRLGSTPS